MRVLSLLAGLFFAASIALGGDLQIITMENGTTLKLLGTSNGSHHMAPGYENLRGQLDLHRQQHPRGLD